MSEELLPYYQRELTYLRRLGKDFARRYPDVAAALHLGEDSTEDPHVERLIMAFAFLTGRIRQKLDDDFPELTHALLEALYPHYLAPVPSMAIVEFGLDRGKADMTQGYEVTGGRLLETSPIHGEPCTFRTCYPVKLWPLEVTGARMVRRPFTIGESPADAQCALVLELSCFAKEVPFSALQVERLRFYLHGQAPHAFALYEQVFNDTLEVTISNAAAGARPVRLGRESIHQVGFDARDGMLPYPARSALGFRLLTEYFAYPRKFCFFDLEVPAQAKASLGSKVLVTLYLDRIREDVEKNVSADMFRLGCTPVVNLFRRQADSIRLTHRAPEYRVVPDRRRREATEVHSIDRVTASEPSGEEVEYHPFYSVAHALDSAGERRTRFWHASRRPATAGLDHVDHGTEVFLSLVDLDFSPASAGETIVHVEATCLNRDLPNQLPFGGGEPRLHVVDGEPEIAAVSCLTRPTPTLRQGQRSGARWRLVSHLTLNHLSISGDERGAEALQEILKLYDYTDSVETQSKIRSVRSVATSPAVGRLPAASSSGSAVGGICRGVRISLELDEKRFADNGLFLFASVLERFLGLYCSINSFTQLEVKTPQRSGVLRRWHPRAGERLLV